MSPPGAIAIFYRRCHFKTRSNDSTYTPLILSHAGTMTGFVSVYNYMRASGEIVVVAMNSNDMGSPFSFHASGVTIARVDGSVGTLDPDIDFEVLGQMVYIDDLGN